MKRIWRCFWDLALLLTLRAHSRRQRLRALFSFRSTRLEQLRVEPEEYALFTIPVVELASRLPSAESHSLSLSVVPEQVFHGARNRLRIPRIYQKATPGFPDNLPPQGKV